MIMVIFSLMSLLYFVFSLLTFRFNYYGTSYLDLCFYPTIMSNNHNEQETDNYRLHIKI